MRRAALWLLIVLNGAASACAAGFPADSIRAGRKDSATVSVLPRHSATADTTVTGHLRTKSAGTALMLSAILPGAGQFYNESYWKVPVVLGFGGYFVVQWLRNNSLYKDYRSQYSASISQVTGGDPYLLSLREFYKDQRDSFTWYFLILYFVNLADAYVDASLFGFDVSGDLSAVHPPIMTPGPPAVGLTLRYRF
jgi:hypothetical protein